MAIAFPTKPASETSTAQATPDLVDQMALRVAALIAAERWNTNAQTKARKAGDGSEESSLKSQFYHLEDALLATQAAAALMRATTLRGAMLQVMVASDQAMCLWDHASFAGNAVNDEQRAQADMLAAKAFRSVSACLYSILGVLSQASGIDPEALGSDYMMPSECDPHVRVASAIAYGAEA